MFAVSGDNYRTGLRNDPATLKMRIDTTRGNFILVERGRRKKTTQQRTKYWIAKSI